MVPTAELDALEPMIRSPSWWPGTRRPSASGRPLADRDRADDPAARLAAAAALPGAPAGPQRRLQLPLELPARVDVDALVDALVAEPHRRVVRIQHLQPPADLLRGVPPVQQPLDPRVQDRVAGQLRRLRAALPLPGQPVRPFRLVSPGARVGVTGQLPADGRRA